MTNHPNRSRARREDLVRVWLSQAERELAFELERYPADVERHAILARHVAHYQATLPVDPATDAMSADELLTELFS